MKWACTKSLNKYMKEKRTGLELGACVLVQLAASVLCDLGQVVLSGPQLPYELKQLDLAVGDSAAVRGLLALG